jgi:hypothetical protein
MVGARLHRLGGARMATAAGTGQAGLPVLSRLRPFGAVVDQPIVQRWLNRKAEMLQLPRVWGTFGITRHARASLNHGC